jgi:hypothetical protein
MVAFLRQLRNSMIISKAPWNKYPEDVYAIVALDLIGDTIVTIEKYMDIPLWF